MSDTENQDLSVEDILSSIKNILVDENGAPIDDSVEQTPAQPLSIPEPIVVTEELEINDVFNLDDSMILDEPQNITEDIENLINQTPVDEIPVQPMQELAQTEEIIVSEAPISDIDIQNTFNIEETENLSSLPEIDNLLEENKTEDLTIPEPVVAAEEPIISPVSEVKEETIDASASIINNFAKVFAEKQQEQAQQVVAAEIPAPKTQTIEDSVRDSIEKVGITDMVKQAILEQVKTSIDSHFEQIASDIIAEQTQKWLNEHLAEIVEKTVAKEIERVIAKVGA